MARHSVSRSPHTLYRRRPVHSESDCSKASSKQPIEFKVAPTRPRVLYSIAFFVIVASLIVRAALWQYPAIHAVDGLLALGAVVITAYQILMQHMKGIATKKRTQLDRSHTRSGIEQMKDALETSDIVNLTHCLVVLHCNEPEYMLYNLIEQLANQRAQGAKVLLLAMEACTQQQAQKVQTIKDKFGDTFSDILVSVHQLKEGEIAGTGSNHYEAQKVAAQYFKNPEDVILSKFDSNVCIAGNLLEEIEMHWLRIDAKSRAAVTFIPRVAWSMTTTDSKRPASELSASCLANPFLCLAPYSMSFVSGSLDGVCRVGGTPVSFLAEDELVYTKKKLLLDNAKSVRLSAIYLKTHEARDMSSKDFILKVYMSKVKRWIVGWVETQDYILRWAVGAIDGHPSLSRRRVAQVVLRNVFQWYMFFVMPFNSFFMLTLGAPPGSFAVGLQVLTYTITLFIIALYQKHLYQSFDFLAFDWTTIPRLVAGSQAFYPLLPWFMLWVFAKQSILDQPIGHSPAPSTSPKKERKGMHDHIRQVLLEPWMGC